jgi:hypothetical protein
MISILLLNILKGHLPKIFPVAVCAIGAVFLILFAVGVF